MNALSNTCRECKTDISEAIANGATSCPSCGWWFKLSKEPRTKWFSRWPRKRFLFLVFLCFLIGTPVNLVLASTYLNMDQNMMMLLFAVGCLGSGFTLAKLFVKKSWVFWILGLVISICVGALYLGSFIALIFYAMAHGGGC